MKKTFQKIASAMTFALLFATVVSCNSKPNDGPDEPDPVKDGLTVALHITPYYPPSLTKHPQIIEALHLLKFAEVDFSRDHVAPADTAKVKAELLAEADVFYREVIDMVNAFDFKTLFSTEIVYIVDCNPSIFVENKRYQAVINVQKPLVWDKTWSTSVADSPVKEMSFAFNQEPIEATLTLQDGSRVQATSVRRSVSLPNLVIVKSNDTTYRFLILTDTQMQLSFIGDVDISSKNYIFNHKN